MKPEKTIFNSQFSPLDSPVLNPEELERLTQDFRSYFIEEEAPELLAILEKGILQIQRDPKNLQEEGSVLSRTAHFLKGGAGMAQLPAVSRLAHKMEAVLLELQRGRYREPAAACGLLRRILQAIKNLLDVDNNSKKITLDAPVRNHDISQKTTPKTHNLDTEAQEKRAGKFQVINQEKSLDATDTNISSSAVFARRALLVDLEESLQQVEQSLNLKFHSPEAIEQISQQTQASLNRLAEKCIRLATVLHLSWLKETGELLAQALKHQKIPLKQLGMTAVAHLRQMRGEFLGEKPAETRKIAETSKALTPTGIPGRFFKYLVDLDDYLTGKSSLSLRMPVARLDRMSNTAGELFINYERLAVYQQQLNQASRNLKKHFEKLIPIADEIGSFSGQASFDLMNFEEFNGHEETNVNSQFSGQSFKAPEKMRGFQELLVQVRETREDVDLIAHELQETLEQLHTSIERLHEDLTESRLVPFGLLAEQFQADLQMLRQQYCKSVELVVEGEETLVDQAILQQLQTPLIHLLRNAFVHGIESAAERKTQSKLPIAKITLSAAIQGSHVVIALADDGRGIDLQKVYRQALEMGLVLPQDSELDEQEPALTNGEILEFLFAPGFSTAATVSELSGRGMGLDIVRQQVGNLRGSVQVETAVNQGTKFTITIPLALSLLTLLLCRCGQQTLAIPSIDVLEIISLSEISSPTKQRVNSSLSSVFKVDENGMIEWNEQSVLLFSLIELLPYRRLDILPATPSLRPNLGIVLEVCGEPVVVAVDALLGERELVLKPFDSTVPVPIYIAGCTVLGTGEVVPVLSPNQLNELIHQAKQARLTDNLAQPRNFQKLKIKNQENLLYSQAISPSILIVDDSITVRRALDELLTKAGYQVVQCRDGKQALEQLHKLGEYFDLVISDIEMPRLDGFALLAEIRAHPNTRRLPIAILTSRESDSLRQQAMSLGATAYFTKPWEPAQLLDAIAALVTF